MERNENYRIVPYDSIFRGSLRQLARLKLDEESVGRGDITLEDDTGRIATLFAPPDAHFLMALVDDEVVGMGGVRRLSDADCELRSLYVHRDFRRQGIASAIFADLLAFARSRSYARLLFSITPAMVPSAEIYKRYGFVELSQDDELPWPGRFMAMTLR